MAFQSNLMLTISLLLATAAIGIAFARRVDLPRATAVLFVAGILFFALATGRPVWMRATDQVVSVIVDLTPATRGAGFRDPVFLKHRLGQLLSGQRYRLISFDHLPPPGMGNSAVLLFGAGRFSAAMDSPRVYPVLDPLLESQADAAITAMALVGNQVSVSVVNNGLPRILKFQGVVGDATETITGNRTFLKRVDPSAKIVRAEISGGELWPENDSASIIIPPAAASARWWIGPAAPPGWVGMAELPTDAARYLEPSVIALNNLDAGEISDAGRLRLGQYVSDLGGGLLIFGGDHAYGAGGYEGTILGSLSPLSSSPPLPTRQWILLADSSGSMSAAESDRKSRWNHAAAAMLSLLPHLPQDDRVRIGQFSRELKWWSQDQSAEQTSKLPLPPADATANGPTNLEQVLNQIAGEAPRTPAELVLVTDADVKLDDPAALAARLKRANIRLHLMAIGNGSGLSQLEQIISATGGSELTQSDSAKWPATLARLLSAALADLVGREPMPVKFTGEATNLPEFTAALWDRTWLNPRASPLATGSGDLPMAANWRVGLGRVLATAFSPTPEQTEALARLVEQPPLDPRFKVKWETGPTWRVRVDASDGGMFLNKLPISVLWEQKRYSVPQTAPGLYELTLAAEAQSAVATVFVGDQVIDRSAISGWYAPEFAAVGENLAGLQTLASKTGGMVIPPTRTTPVEFDSPRREYFLTSCAALIGAVLISTGLILWKRSNAFAYE